MFPQGNPMFMPQQFGVIQNNPPQFFNYGGNQNWRQNYNLNNNQNSFQPSPNQNTKINIVFRTSNGRLFNVLFDPERTVEELILTFFKRVDKEELFTQGGVAFVHNALQIDYHNKEKVKNLFKFSVAPIMVLDVNNLIGA